MSWEEISPTTTPSTGVNYAPVEFKIGYIPGSGKRPCAVILVRERLLQSAPSWLTKGARVRVLRGAGEDAGVVRLLPGGAVPVGAAGCGTTLTAMIRVPLWDGLPVKPMGAAVTFRVSADCLDIDLPGWARVLAVRASPVVAAAPVIPSRDAATTVRPPIAAVLTAPMVKSGMQGKPDEARAFSMLGGAVPVAGRP